MRNQEIPVTLKIHLKMYIDKTSTENMSKTEHKECEHSGFLDPNITTHYPISNL